MNKYVFPLKYNDIPKYIQIADRIKKLMDNNEIEDGEKLPSIRKLSLELNVNCITIVNAYKKLQNEGYAVQKIGSGTYAKRKDFKKNFKREYSEEIKKINGEKLKEYIDFSGEAACSDIFEVETFKNVLNEVLERDGIDALIYQEALGYEGLRESIDKYFWNGDVGACNILIISGAQQGIDVVAKALINVNDNVIIEKPTYSGALAVFKWRRANIFEVPVEYDGIDLEKFEKIVKKNKIKCFYTMSYFQNPTGISYCHDKKEALLKLAEKYDFYIIEDDYLSELIYDDKIKYESFKSLDRNDRVIYIKSFSKIFLPGIRIGYMICPLKFKESIQNSKVNTDISTSSLMQRALELYIRKGYWKEHIDKLNRTYKGRYYYIDSCMKNLFNDKASFKSPGGGLNFYLKIDDGILLNSMQLFNECKSSKILITPGVLFYKNASDGDKFFRLGFSQTEDDKIYKGIFAISKILEGRKKI